MAVPLFSDGINALIGIAASACAADTEIEAADYWTMAFAHFFPLPDTRVALAEDTLAKSMSLVPVTLPDVLVLAVGQKNSNIRIHGKNAIGPIPKDCDIMFEIAEPWKLPPGTTVEWIVRNDGSEAENVNDLGHRAGTGYKVTRPSAYNGSHFMDCVLRQNGRIYGVRRIPVRISGISAPLRNPVRQPAYTQIRGRR